MRILGIVLLLVVAAGCGTTRRPALQRADAAGLIALSHRIAGERACGQARDIRVLRRRAIALVNAGRVPAELQEPLLSAVAALGDETPVCLPPVTASTPPPPPKEKHGHGPGHGKGDKHGHGDEG